MHVSKFAVNGNGGDSTAFSIGSYAIAGIFRTLWTLGRLKESDGKPSTIRAFCQSKNNYAEFDPPALLFKLCDGFHWVGVDRELTAEDLYNKAKLKGRPADKKEAVKATVLKLLAGGEPMLSAELETQICKLTGCHPQTLKTVKKELGVECFQLKGKWHSVLSEQSTKNSDSEEGR